MNIHYSLLINLHNQSGRTSRLVLKVKKASRSIDYSKRMIDFLYQAYS